jgi:hypothetical protein
MPVTKLAFAIGVGEAAAGLGEGLGEGEGDGEGDGLACGEGLGEGEGEEVAMTEVCAGPAADGETEGAAEGATEGVAAGELPKTSVQPASNKPTERNTIAAAAFPEKTAMPKSQANNRGGV